MMSLCCRFKDTLECELITVKAFISPYTVSSYRLAKLSDGFYKETEMMNHKQTELLESLSKQNTVLDGECCSIFAMRCHASAACAVIRCLPICLSVCHIRHILSKRINISSKNFSPLGSHTILVFPYQTLWQFRRGPP